MDFDELMCILIWISYGRFTIIIIQLNFVIMKTQREQL